MQGVGGKRASANEQAAKHLLAGLIHIEAAESEKKYSFDARNGDIYSRPRYVAQIRLSALYASICYVVCLL
jgi:hypothetical protein